MVLMLAYKNYLFVEISFLASCWSSCEIY